MSERDRLLPARPVIGVGAVVLDGDSVLLVQRGHAPLKGEWSLPGGAVELGETLAAALAREVLEETGIQIDVGPVVDVLDRLHRDEDGRLQFHYVVVDYLCRPLTKQIAYGSDADNARWVSRSDLPAYGVNQVAIEVIDKARSMRSETLAPNANP
jgi:mutator protein MutT